MVRQDFLSDAWYGTLSERLRLALDRAHGRVTALLFADAVGNQVKREGRDSPRIELAT